MTLNEARQPKPESDLSKAFAKVETEHPELKGRAKTKAVRVELAILKEARRAARDGREPRQIDASTHGNAHFFRTFKEGFQDSIAETGASEEQQPGHHRDVEKNEDLRGQPQAKCPTGPSARAHLIGAAVFVVAGIVVMIFTAAGSVLFLGAILELVRANRIRNAQG